MCKKFGNLWLEYRDPIELMDHPSNMRLACVGVGNGTNNKSTCNLITPFDGRLKNNNCNSFHDKHSILRCLWVTSKALKVFNNFTNNYIGFALYIW